MRLSIRNIGKIHKADILIDGVTVLAAPNNTGKSTVGKAMFALFDTFDLLNKKISRNLKNSIKLVIVRNAPDREDPDGIVSTWEAASFVSGQLVSAKKTPKSKDDLLAQLRTIRSKQDGLSHLDESGRQLIVWLSSEDKKALKCRDAILKLFSVKKEDKTLELAERTFNQVFNDQVCSFGMDSQKSEVSVTTDEHFHGEIDRYVSFKEGACIEAGPVSDESRRVLILDDPNIIERFTPSSFTRKRFFSDEPFSGEPPYRSRAINVASETLVRRENEISFGLGEAVLAKQTVREVLEVIEHEFSGRLIQSKKGPAMVGEDDSSTIAIGNASMGCKAMMLLRFLVENSVIQDDDILVLDEPEIHLHPQWQITYAHALMLIAKHMGIHVLVTTHSPYFLQAIVDYADILDYTNKTAVYSVRPENKDGLSVFERLDNEGIADVFTSMARPFATLQQSIAEHLMKG